MQGSQLHVVNRVEAIRVSLITFDVNCFFEDSVL